jgi:transglutaminase-like putative cysteine protease
VTQTAREQLALPLLDAAGLDLDGAGRVTYVLHQRFSYDYVGSAYDLDHRLVAVPRARHGSQRRLTHHVDVSAAEAQVVSRRDGLGNVVTRVRLGVVPERVEFAVSAVVERCGPVTGPVLPASALTDPRLLRPTRLTTPDAALRQVAAELRRTSRDDFEIAEAACAFVHSAIAYEYGPTSVSTTAAEAFAGGRGVCQDHAHVMIALCRAAGVPTRYVSGHLLGEGGSHAWVEAVLPEGDRARAVAFDPCNGCRAGAAYVTVATGRDYSDVAPTSGRYAGDATGQLTVTKRVGVVAAA